jgi:pimeloyl-ACP methyl ester carboxylesterase
LARQSYPSPFEDGLHDQFAVMISEPSPASFLVGGLVDAPVADAALKLRCPRRRADAVLRLPPLDLLRDLLSPLRDAASFRNYMNRIVADERYDIGQALSRIRAPIMMVVGSHDAVINTSSSRTVMKTYGRNVTQATLQGAGHHSHIMQYTYFRNILETFCAGLPLPDTARLGFEKLR